jgi:hypothetical protein
MNKLLVGRLLMDRHLMGRHLMDRLLICESSLRMTWVARIPIST